jgi:hypothetical protein
MERIDPGFHWTEGWYFQRLANGDVRIRKHERDDHYAPILEQATIPAAQWCSIVAAMSRTGESGSTYDAAAKIHDGWFR